MPAKTILYNGGNVSGNLSSSFSRAATTRDDRGNEVGPDQRRFGRACSFATEVDWKYVDDWANGNAAVYATGYDIDGEPLLIHDNANPQKIVVRKGKSLEIVREWSYLTGDDLLGGAVSGKRYLPKAAIIFHGFVAIMCRRYETTGGNYEGTTIVYSPDLGATLTRVPIAAADGGGSDIPAISGSPVAVDAGPGREWAFKHAWPTSPHSKLGAWLCGVDYVDKASDPGGGQAFAFRITRPDTDSEFNVEPIRVVHEAWDGTQTAVHWHACNPCINDNCFHIHVGDDAARSRIISVPWDLGNYATATKGTPVDALGLQSTDGNLSADSPQTLSVAPAPNGVDYIGPSDVSHEQLYRFEADGQTRVKVTELRRATPRDEVLWEALHLDWEDGIGYAYGANSNSANRQACLLSYDGVNWAEINVPEYDAGEVFFFDGKLFWSKQLTGVGAIPAGDAYVAELPTITTIEPLQLAPGKTNLMDQRVSETSPTAPNTRNDTITFENGVWLDDGTPLEVQPPPPPFKVDQGTTFRMISTAGASTSYNFGRFFLRSTTDYDETQESCAMRWYCNINRDYHVRCIDRHGWNSGNDVVERIRSFNQWVPAPHHRPAEGGGSTNGLRHWAWSPDSAVRTNQETDLLCAIDQVVYGDQLSYPLDLDQTGPSELEVVSGMVGDLPWTATVIWQWDRRLLWIATGTYYVATLWQDANNYHEISCELLTATTANVIIDHVVSGSSVGTTTLAIDAQREQIVSLSFSNTGGRIEAVGRNGALPSVTATTTAATPIEPVQLRWSNNDQTEIGNINPIKFEFIEGEAQTQTQLKRRMASSLEGFDAEALKASFRAGATLKASAVANGQVKPSWR